MLTARSISQKARGQNSEAEDREQNLASLPLVSGRGSRLPSFLCTMQPPPLAMSLAQSASTSSRLAAPLEKAVAMSTPKAAPARPRRRLHRLASRSKRPFLLNGRTAEGRSDGEYQA